MSRFLGIGIFLVVAMGLMLHTGAEFPSFMEWVGDLPGDMIIKKGNVSVYAPLTSSFLISAVISFLLSLVSSKN